MNYSNKYSIPTKSKFYIRDGRAPIPQKELTSRIMSSVKAKNTKPELLLRKILFKNNLRGYRLHWKKAPGHPDICYPYKKIAIFVHGCFWHSCPYCKPKHPKTHSLFWEKKFKDNKQRDKKKKMELIKLGWKVFIIWECKIKEGILDSILNQILKYKNT